jgi:hypothetical protein
LMHSVTHCKQTEATAILSKTHCAVVAGELCVQRMLVDLPKYEFTCAGWSPNGKSLLICAMHVRGVDGSVLTLHDCVSQQQKPHNEHSATFAQGSLTSLYESREGYFVAMSVLDRDVHENGTRVAVVHTDAQVSLAQWMRKEDGESFALLCVLRIPISMSMRLPRVEWISKTQRLVISQAGMVGVWGVQGDMSIDPEMVRDESRF